MIDDLPPYGVIRQELCEGKVIPFLGAGASVCSRADKVAWVKSESNFLPTGAELGAYLADTSGYPEEPAGDLAKVAQWFSAKAGRPVLRRWLNDIFAPEYPFCAVHQFLARVPSPLLIVTTNYDDLIERAFDKVHKPYDLVIYPTDNKDWLAKVLHRKHGDEEWDVVSPKKLSIDMEQTTVIFKMHGAMDRKDLDRSSFVISEDDYTDFVVRVAYKTAVPACFAEQVRTRHLLFLGYSLRDWNLRVVLSKIDKDLPRPPADKLRSWAIQKDATTLEKELWEQRGISLYREDLQEFISKLDTEKNEGKRESRA